MNYKHFYPFTGGDYLFVRNGLKRASGKQLSIRSWGELPAVPLPIEIPTSVWAANEGQPEWLHVQR